MEALAAALRQSGWRFYDFMTEGICRLMCAWDMEPVTVDQLAADIAALAGAKRKRA